MRPSLWEPALVQHLAEELLRSWMLGVLKEFDGHGSLNDSACIHKRFEGLEGSIHLRSFSIVTAVLLEVDTFAWPSGSPKT